MISIFGFIAWCLIVFCIALVVIAEISTKLKWKIIELKDKVKEQEQQIENLKKENQEWQDEE